ncbi:MAG: TetR family transcriptional regulator [Bacteroidales bacterium]|jgi:AcrR family transcriptional regulator|nr:TetR family transcriptional regulator [Bacteroidales bacterium]
MNEIQLKIIDSAKSIFIKKGYEGTSIRDIATDADVNIAMVNYYFRSKENLFQQIFMEIYGDLLQNAIEGKNENLTLREKIDLLVSFILENVTKTPRLPLFVIEEINRDAEKVLNEEFIRGITRFSEFFQRQIQEEIDAGSIRPVDPIDLFINIVSMCIFPFLGLPVLGQVIGGNDFDVSPFIDHRKEQIIDFVIRSLQNI